MHQTLTSTGETFDNEYYRTHYSDLSYLRSTLEWHRFLQSIADAIVLGLRASKGFRGRLRRRISLRKALGPGRRDAWSGHFGIRYLTDQGRRTDLVRSALDRRADPRDLRSCTLYRSAGAHADRGSPRFNPKHDCHRAPNPFLIGSYRPGRSMTINLRPTRYWLERFAEAGFAPAPGFDATFLSPYAILFERSDEGRDDRSLAAFAEIVRQRLEVAKVLQTGRETHNRLEREVADLKMIEGQLRSELHSSRIRESKSQAMQNRLASVDAARRESAAAIKEIGIRLQAETSRANVAESRVRLLEQPKGRRIVRNIQRIPPDCPLWAARCGGASKGHSSGKSGRAVCSMPRTILRTIPMSPRTG